MGYDVFSSFSILNIGLVEEGWVGGFSLCFFSLSRGYLVVSKGSAETRGMSILIAYIYR